MPVTVIPAPAFPLEWQWSWVALNNSLGRAAPLEALRLNPCGILLQESADRGLQISKQHPHLWTSAAGLPSPQCEPDLRVFHGTMGTRRRTSPKLCWQGKVHELLLWFVAFKKHHTLWLISGVFVWLFFAVISREGFICFYFRNMKLYLCLAGGSLRMSGGIVGLWPY